MQCGNDAQVTKSFEPVDLDYDLLDDAAQTMRGASCILDAIAGTPYQRSEGEAAALIMLQDRLRGAADDVAKFLAAYLAREKHHDASADRASSPSPAGPAAS